MEINDQLSKPLIERLCYEYKELESELAHHSSEDAEELKTWIQKRISRIETFNYSAQVFSPQEYLSPDFRETTRQLKLDLRFAKRRWQRIRLNEGRLFKRRQSKDLLPASCAA